LNKLAKIQNNKTDIFRYYGLQISKTIFVCWCRDAFEKCRQVFCVKRQKQSPGAEGDSPVVGQVVDERPPDDEGHRDAEEEAHPHVPLVHHGVGGEAVVVGVLMVQRRSGTGSTGQLFNM